MNKIAKIVTNALAAVFGVLAILYLIEFSHGDTLYSFRLFAWWVPVLLGALVLATAIFGKVAKLKVNLPLRIIAAAILFLTAIPNFGQYLVIYFADAVVAGALTTAYLSESKTQTNKLVKLFGILAYALLVAAEMVLSLSFFVDLYVVAMILFIATGVLFITRGVFGILDAFKKEPAAE